MFTPTDITAPVTKEFQLGRNTIAEKSSDRFGLEMARHVSSTISANSTFTYYAERNMRYRRNRSIVSGRADFAYLKELLKIGGTDAEGKEIKDFVKVSDYHIKLGNRILGGLVGRWMGRKEKIDIKARDPFSEKARTQQLDDVRYYMENYQQLSQMQQQSGVNMIPQGQFIPEDEEQLLAWHQQFNRLPEEISTEVAVNEVMTANGLYGPVKSQILHDSGGTGFTGTYTWMDQQGVIHTERVKAENAIYSYSEYDDFRDTTLRGMIKSMKLHELRRDFGQEFGGPLSEQDLWELAALCKEYQIYDKKQWQPEWAETMLRPYDEWNLDVVIFEWKTTDAEAYTITDTKLTGSTYVQRGSPVSASGKPRPPKENQKVVEDTNINIYEGIFVRQQPQRVLRWGLKKNMIRPLDPRERGNADFSFSFCMPQQQDMRNVAIPEKIEEPLQQMLLARKRIEILIAAARPPGAAINRQAVQNIDLGLGGTFTELEQKRLFDQTGLVYYNSVDAEGNPIPIPITELANAGFAPQMEAFIKDYAFHYQVLKDELGEDPNLLQAAAQPRVAASNVEASREEAEFATDYFYDAYLNVMEQTAQKITCLLHASLSYGAEVYRTYIEPDQVKGREFYATCRMLPRAGEIQRFEMMMQEVLKTNPDITLFCDPMQLSRIAEEDVKMAELLFRSAQKRQLRYNIQQKQQDAQMNAQAQQQSLMMKAQQDQEALKLKIQLEDAAEARRSTERKEEILLQGIMNIMAKGLDVKPEWVPVATLLIDKVCIPMLQSNVENTQALSAALGQFQQQQQAQQQQPQGQPGAPDQGQPQQAQQAQPQMQ